MNRYERAYGTDWVALDRAEAIERAYALGVASTIGEHQPGELEAIRAEMETAYDQSMVELSFDEGKHEARAVDTRADERAVAVWADLVEGETATGDDAPTGGRGLPDAVDRIAALERADRDSTAVVERPEFLERN